jgi:sugar phosphate permease
MTDSRRAFIKKYGTLLLLATGAGIIFQLPYIRETFYPQIQEAMGLTNAQMGLLSSGYSTVALFSYFIGGIIADKFSARKLLAFSFITTGLLGLWFSTFPSYNIARLILVLMGISTIITYWSACIKATRMLGTSEEQGRLFGLQEGLRGVMNALLVFGMTWAFVYFSAQSEVIGTSAAIKVVSIVNIILGILHYIFIEDTQTAENSQSLKEVTKGMFKVLTIPRVWILIAIVFTAYSVYGLIGYVNTYAVKYFGLSAALGSTLGGVRYLVQGLGGVVGGFLADKLKSRIKIIILGCIGLVVCFGLMIVLPGNAVLLPAIIISFLFGLLFIYAVRSQYFAIHDDAGIPVHLSGRVSGIVSSLGYTPDIFMFTLVGFWMDSYGIYGFKMTWAYAVVAAVLCIVLSLVLNRIIKKQPKIDDSKVA